MAWREDMGRQQYMELRRELAALQNDMGVDDPADRERSRHVEQLLAETDSFFGVDRNAYIPVVSPNSPKNSQPAAEVKPGEPVPVTPPGEIPTPPQPAPEKGNSIPPAKTQPAATLFSAEPDAPPPTAPVPGAVPGKKEGQ